MTTQLTITQVRTDGGTQPRIQLDLAIIADYAEAMADGAMFPPITVFYDGADYWLADGFHRLAAIQQLGLADISADVRQGTQQDAQWHSYSVNQSHGLRRTNDDKRRAAEAALAHPYANRYSSREIARHCGVSHQTIENYRDRICQILTDEPRIVTRNGTTYEMNTANIGRQPDRLPFNDDELTPYEQQIAAQYDRSLPIEADETARLEDGYASQMKPKINRAGDIYEPRGFDSCQTPPEAIDPLLPYLPMDWSIWEPACGEGTLVEAFYDADRQVIGTDIITGANFFTCDGPSGWDCIVTNPPYSIKYEWLERCYALDRPFALLLPVETLGAQKAQRLFAEYGVGVILLNRRINFKMPNIGWEGSAAQFPVAWFTWRLDLETQIVFGRLP